MIKKKRYCLDDRHATPCLLPCLACEEECGSTGDGMMGTDDVQEFRWRTLSAEIERRHIGEKLALEVRHEGEIMDAWAKYRSDNQGGEISIVIIL